MKHVNSWKKETDGRPGKRMTVQVGGRPALLFWGKSPHAYRQFIAG